MCTHVQKHYLCIFKKWLLAYVWKFKQLYSSVYILFDYFKLFKSSLTSVASEVVKWRQENQLHNLNLQDYVPSY